MVRLTPLSSGMRVEWIESKDGIRARRADKKARHSNTRFGRTNPARLTLASLNMCLGECHWKKLLLSEHDVVPPTRHWLR